MVYKILSGKPVVESIISEAKEMINGKNARMDIILVGKNPASEIYVRNKVKQAESIGIKTVVHRLGGNIKEEEVLKLVQKLNKNPEVNGFIVQLPLPKHINQENIINAIDPNKDIDGFHPLNIGALCIGKPKIIPATPLGIIKLLDYYNIPIEGRNAVVIGRSNIVGKPISMLLLQRNATITICHSKTKNLETHTRKADILVSAVGKAGLISADMVKKNAVVIDVGINRINGKIVGDVDFGNVIKKANCTPVPGGIGPTTVASLIYNLAKRVSIRDAKIRNVKGI